MFETARGLGQQIQKHVFLVRKRSPHLAVPPRQFLRIGRRARAVPHASLALVRQKMRDTLDLELVHGRVPAQDGRVDQRVVVLRQPAIRPRFRQTRHRHLPLRRQIQPHLMGRSKALHQSDKCRSTVQKREGLFHPVRPDRHFPAIDTVGEIRISFSAARPDQPYRFYARFLEAQGISGQIGSRNGFDISSILAHKVRTRRPDREEDFDLRSTARGQKSFDREIMRSRLGEANQVP